MRKIEKIIIDRLATKHNISKEQAVNIYLHYGAFIKQSLEECTKDEDGVFNPDSFKVVHLTGFGKIIPSRKKINIINNLKIKSNDKYSNNTNV